MTQSIHVYIIYTHVYTVHEYMLWNIHVYITPLQKCMLDINLRSTVVTYISNEGEVQGSIPGKEQRE